LEMLAAGHCAEGGRGGPRAGPSSPLAAPLPRAPAPSPAPAACGGHMRMAAVKSVHGGGQTMAVVKSAVKAAKRSGPGLSGANGRRVWWRMCDIRSSRQRGGGCREEHEHIETRIEYCASLTSRALSFKPLLPPSLPLSLGPSVPNSFTSLFLDFPLFSSVPISLPPLPPLPSPSLRAGLASTADRRAKQGEHIEWNHVKNRYHIYTYIL
jgi:hypothetical protein